MKIQLGLLILVVLLVSCSSQPSEAEKQKVLELNGFNRELRNKQLEIVGPARLTDREKADGYDSGFCYKVRFEADIIDWGKAVRSVVTLRRGNDLTVYNDVTESYWNGLSCNAPYEKCGFYAKACQ